MQFFKSAMVVTSALFVAALAANGCSSKGGGETDGGGDAKITPTDGKAPDGKVNPVDSGACGSGLDCEVCDVTNYSKPTMGTPTTMKGACTSQELSDFATACWSASATQTTCGAWQKAQPDGGTCAVCLAPSLQANATWGPLDCESQTSGCGANSGGCVDLVLKQTSQERVSNGSGSCGDLVSDNFGCQDYACSACAQADVQTCQQSAIANECKSYVDAVSSDTGACAAINGDAAPPQVSSCFPQNDSDIANFLDIFCGPDAL